MKLVFSSRLSFIRFEIHWIGWHEGITLEREKLIRLLFTENLKKHLAWYLRSFYCRRINEWSFETLLWRLNCRFILSQPFGLKKNLRFVLPLWAFISSSLSLHAVVQTKICYLILAFVLSLRVWFEIIIYFLAHWTMAIKYLQFFVPSV